MWPLLVFVAVLASSVIPSHAAYTAASVQGQEELGNGMVRYQIRFVGNAGEKLVVLPYEMVPAATEVLTREALERWTDGVLKRLNVSESVKGALIPGSTITPRAPVTPTRPAKAEWQLKARTCLAYKDHFTGPLAADVNALCADVQRSYQKGFLDE